MYQTIFKGSGVALITPMNSDYTVNYELLEQLIEKQISRHTDAIIITGTTGEASTLSVKEQTEVIRFTVSRAAHRIPVIAGAGSNCTAHAVELSQQAQKAGANALLQVTPYYNKCSQAGLVSHFHAIAASTDLPIILYNIPSRTGVNILPQTYEQLCEAKNIVGVKEASGNFSQIAKIASICGSRLDIYSGNDDQITSALALGAKGVISVLANILPQETHDICESFFQGHPEISDELQLKYLELIEALFYDVNPIPVKQAMRYMGIPVGPCRLPLCEMEPVMAEKLLKVMKKYQLTDQKVEDDFHGKASILHETGRSSTHFVRRHYQYANS